MRVTRAMYLAAIRTTIMERQRKSGQSLEADEEGGIQFNATDVSQDSSTPTSQPSKKFSMTKTSPPPIMRQSSEGVIQDDSGISANKFNSISDSNNKSNSNNDNVSHNSTDSIESFAGNQFKHNTSQSDEKSHLI